MNRQPVRLWIDCEFNDFQGELISIALVAEDGREFYASLGCEDPSPWVARHVMPIIGIKPESMVSLQARLQRFLRNWREVCVIADWPEDLKHLCAALITGPGCAIETPRMTFVLDRELSGESALPHNALEDARANRLATMKKEHCHG